MSPTTLIRPLGAPSPGGRRMIAVRALFSRVSRRIVRWFLWWIRREGSTVRRSSNATGAEEAVLPRVRRARTTAGRLPRSLPEHNTIGRPPRRRGRRSRRSRSGSSALPRSPPGRASARRSSSSRRQFRWRWHWLVAASWRWRSRRSRAGGSTPRRSSRRCPWRGCRRRSWRRCGHRANARAMRSGIAAIDRLRDDLVLGGFERPQRCGSPWCGASARKAPAWVRGRRVFLLWHSVFLKPRGRAAVGSRQKSQSRRSIRRSRRKSKERHVSDTRWRIGFSSSIVQL